ncbi:hypothetical protein M3Y99_00141000 [Aphelenchoides fujianensis]|nr:hypothetical protein M3Y99_00141000 [Aphelenchoides fujianensis]
MSANVRETLGRRRRRAERAREEQRAQAKKRPKIDDDSEEEPETPRRQWCCTVCPLILETNNVRVLLPCGHIFCDACAETMGKSCVRCGKAVKRFIHPCMQECEPAEDQQSEEQIRAECAKLEAQARAFEAELAELQAKHEKEMKILKNQEQFLDFNIKNMRHEVSQANKQAMDATATEAVCATLSRLERHCNFPWEPQKKSDIEAVHLIAVVQARNHLKDLRTKKKVELDDLDRELKRMSAEEALLAEAEAKLAASPSRRPSTSMAAAFGSSSTDSGIARPPNRLSFLDDDDFDATDNVEEVI